MLMSDELVSAETNTLDTAIPDAKSQQEFTCQSF